MPRIAGASIPKYRKHRASGQAVVTIGGRDYYLGPHGTKASRIEYDRLITEWLAGGRSLAFGTPADAITVVELAADYLRFARKYYGGGNRSDCNRIIYAVKPLKELYGKTPAAEFGVLQYKAVRERLIAHGYARSNINAMMARLVRMFKWGAAEGRLPAAVPQNLAIVPGLRRGKCDAKESAPVLPVDDAVVEATLVHLPEVVGDMVRFQRLTGCRPGEVCALRPVDVDCTGDVWLYRPRHHKTAHHGKERTIFVGPKAQAVLLKYLARDSEAHCFRPCDSERKRRAAQHAARTTPLSCGNRPGTNKAKKPRKTAGGAYVPLSYAAAIRRACDAAGVERWSPNRLRHAAATEIRREFGLEAAQVILGHSQANVTQVYAERDAAKGYDVARQIG
ncbi:MAG: site-specific integrase [Pirellulales bacterium]|nr:site-specific integrase [Pirellulales bacterium]